MQQLPVLLQLLLDRYIASVCLFVVNAKTTTRIDAKGSGITQRPTNYEEQPGEYSRVDTTRLSVLGEIL